LRRGRRVTAPKLADEHPGAEPDEQQRATDLDRELVSGEERQDQRACDERHERIQAVAERGPEPRKPTRPETLPRAEREDQERDWPDGRRHNRAEQECFPHEKRPATSRPRMNQPGVPVPAAERASVVPSTAQ
jgi:hypothetical protein